MNAKHTPGPWSFQASPAHGYRIRTSDSTSSLRFGSGDIGVVFFAGNGRSTEQCKADARLIAASPELLEEHQQWAGWLGEALVLALQGDYSKVDELAKTFRIGFESGSAVIKSAAIAKATGSASC